VKATYCRRAEVSRVAVLHARLPGKRPRSRYRRHPCSTEGQAAVEPPRARWKFVMVTGMTGSVTEWSASWQSVADDAPRRARPRYTGRRRTWWPRAGRPPRALGWKASSRRPAMWSTEYSSMLRGASIQRRVHANGLSVQGVRCIETSLIGHGVEVTPAPRVPRVHRLVLGDDSKVRISS
jgi:hypothetical protein